MKHCPMCGSLVWEECIQQPQDDTKRLHDALQEILDEIPAKPKLPLVAKIREMAYTAIRKEAK